MKVFYMPQQVAANPDSFAPSAAKPELVVKDWLHRRLIGPQDIVPFDSVERDDFKRVHNADMVDGVLDLELENGFGNRNRQVAASLPYTSGSMLAAARFALDRSEAVCSPTSGFHHAGHFFPQGYCTFNGLMVTAARLLEENALQTVAIIDCDAHYGNGTEEIIDRLGLRSTVMHHTMGRHFHPRATMPSLGRVFLRWLDDAIESCRSADLILYQAGADPHIRYPLGGMLTGREMALRDQAVFLAFAGRPLVWNLAGGYQRDASGGIEPVLRLHRNTLRACKTAASGSSSAVTEGVSA